MLSVIVSKGYNFSDGEKVTYPKLNLLGTPSVTFSGELASNQLADGAVTTNKLEQGININDKINDHNLSLSKLPAGDHGQLLYYNSSGILAKLSPGTDGQYLKTQGAGQDPVWAAQDGASSVPYEDITTNGLANQYLTTDGSGNVAWIGKPDLNESQVFDTPSLDSIVSAGAPYKVTQSHGLGAVPEQVVVTIRCAADDSATGYSLGDEIDLVGSHITDTAGDYNTASVSFDAINVIVGLATGNLANFKIPHKTNQTLTSVGTGANFKFRIRVWNPGSGSTTSNSAGPLTTEPGYYYSQTSSDTAYQIMTRSGTEKNIESFSHGFSTVPKFYKVVLVCTSDDSQTGYSEGDEIDVSAIIHPSSPGNTGFTSFANTSSITCMFLARATGTQSTYMKLFGRNKTSVDWEFRSSSANRFKLKVYAWK
jgi:hypothetical protein